jgi:glutamate racemase
MTPTPHRNTIIGLFDSGVGGLSVWREVIRRLPQQATIYLGDNLHCPYGLRPAEEVRRFSLGISRFLVEQGAALIVVACNTASAAGLASLRAELDVPVVGMEPAVKPAAERTRSGHIGVLATRGTVNGDLFRNTAAHYARGVTVHVQVGDGLVEQVETGQVDSPETVALLSTYLEPMLASGVDQIALGCTHYAFLTPVMRRIVPESISIIDPAAAVARRVEQVLTNRQMSKPQGMQSLSANRPAGEARFFTSGSPTTLAAMVRTLTGRVPHVESVRWDASETRVLKIEKR